jgi:hypothetical protein
MLWQIAEFETMTSGRNPTGKREKATSVETLPALKNKGFLVKPMRGKGERDGASVSFANVACDVRVCPYCGLKWAH